MVTGRAESPIQTTETGRLWFNDGSCIRLRPQYPDHVWSYDFVHERTYDGRAFRTLNVIDEYSRECLMIRVKRKLNSFDVIDVLTDLLILRGPPAYIRPDNGPEFVAEVDRCCRCKDGLHRTRLTLGERLLRELQRQAPG